MLRRAFSPRRPRGSPLWLGVFGDLMSLLLTFFILLLSMATFDAKKLIEAEANIKGALSVIDGGIKIEKSRNRITLPGDITIPPEYAEEVKLIEQSIIDFNEIPNISQGRASITGDGLNGFIIILPANIVFDDNFNINNDSLLFLKRIAQIEKMMPENVQVEVLGRSNISTSNINLERASNIALSVSRALHSFGVNGNKIHAIGQEDKNLESSKGSDLINIKFYIKEVILKKTKGILDK